MSERELPRPATPGPWSTQGAVRYDRCWFVWAADASIARMAHAELGKAQEQDAAAIAALPEWIEDRDRWKARAEQAEAERGAATDRATEHEMVLSAIADACVSADHPSDVQRVNVIMDLLTAHGYAREAADV